MQGEGLEILSPKQMIQRLPMALHQLKAGITLHGLLNKIRKTVHSLYRSKEVTKNIYNHIIKPIQT